MTKREDFVTSLRPGHHAIGLTTGDVLVFQTAEDFGEDWVVLTDVVDGESERTDVRKSAIVWTTAGAPIRRTP